MQTDLGAQRSIDFLDDDGRMIGVVLAGSFSDTRELRHDRITGEKNAGFEGFEIETLLRSGVGIDYRIVVVHTTIGIRSSRSRSHW